MAGPSHDSQPHRRLAGLQPDALMAQGLADAPAQIVAVPGCEIELPLGRGGMGAVYLARQTSLDREVAVKVLAEELADDPLFLERLEREARTMASLRHPNIVTVHDFQKLADGGAAIVMEFIGGGSLRERLRQHPTGLPLAEALRIIEQIASGLAVAHASGVIHRDMKPENVLLDSHGTARVTDFGLALPLNGTAPRLTLTGTAVGTLDYMAPEQLHGGELDPRLDVYALGVIAYELLTGHIPRGSFDPPHRVRPSIPASLSIAVMKALKPMPADRFESIDAFILALRRQQSPALSRRLWIGALVLLAVAAAAAAALWPRPSSPPAPPLAPGPWRDALAGVRIYEDVFGGDWKNEHGVLTSNQQICVLRLEENLPEFYDVRVQFTRLQGKYSVALFFRAGQSVGSAELDAWNEGLAGVQLIDGESLQAGYGFRFPLTNGRRYEMLIEVRPGLVRLSVDGVLKREFPISPKSLRVVREWEWDPEQRPAALAIGSYMSSTRFEKVDWRAWSVDRQPIR